MKYFRPISLMAALWLTSVPVFCQLPCEANFLNSVELRGQELTLADVLYPGLVHPCCEVPLKYRWGRLPWRVATVCLREEKSALWLIESRSAKE